MDIGSGALGLVVGAALGLVFTVLFEDGLRRMQASASSRLRRLRARRGTLPAPTTEFRLGPLQTSVLIVEGDGQQVIDEQAVRVIVDPAMVTLPDDVAQLRQDIAEQQRQRRRAGLHAHWNGPSYAVTGLSVERNGIDEAPGVCLRLKSSDYYTFLATQQLETVLPDGTTLRAKYLDPYPAIKPPDFMSSSFGTYIAVVTADDQLAVTQRSNNVGAFPQHWDASANEALSRSLDSRGRTPPSLYDVARRGLHEELALDHAEYRLELLAFNLDRKTNQWGCMFAAFLHDTTANELLDRRTRGVADKWEHNTVEVVPFTIEAVIDYLLRPERRECWTPPAPPLYYLTLVRRIAARVVLRAR